MARFYARFDHGIESGLEALTTGNFYERRVIGSTTSSNAFLIAKREALSNAMYAQLEGVNRDPTQGPIIPQSNTAGTVNNITRSGGNLQWNNVYKTTSIPGVAYPADFRTRPTASIFTDDGNVTAADPADNGSISDTLYTDASDALNTVITSIKKTKSGLDPIAPPFTEDGSPYTRLGTNPSRTLHSVWHDPGLNFFAWDDFTPGNPQTFTFSFSGEIAGNPATAYVENSDSLNLIFTWTPEYVADRAGTAILNASTVRDDTSVTIETLTNQLITNGDLFYTWSLGTSLYGDSPSGILYDINSSLKFRDATITSHESSTVTNNQNQYIRIYKVQSVSLYYGADVSSVCSDTSTTTYYIDGAGNNLGGANFIWSNKSGAAASAGYYASTFPGPGTTIRNWQGGDFGANQTCP